MPTKEITKAVWISYDLGVRGDYERLYAWLDQNGARECGDSLAVIHIPNTANMIESIKADLQAQITIDKRSRIYVIYRDDTDNKNKGTFLFGKRKAAPWVGYADDEGDVTDED